MSFTPIAVAPAIQSVPTVDTVSVATTAETVIGSAALPAFLPAGAVFRMSLWCPFAVGATAGSYTIKARIGGLAGNNVGSITTGAWTLSTSGEFSLVAYIKLITPGGPGVGTWEGAIVHSSLAGSQTNTATAGANGIADSTVSEQLVITIAFGSATMTCGPSCAVTERIQ